MARQTAAAPAAPRSKSRRGGATLIIVVGTVLAATMLPLCLLLIAGLMPTAVATIADRHPRRYLARAVAATNLAGMVLPVLGLFDIGVSLPGVQHVLSDPWMWLVMYGMAALGALIDWIMPALARVIVDMRAETLRRQLEERAVALVKEWGKEVGPGGDSGR